jgi:DNA-binding transcriptional LysR family regulator
MNVSDVAIFLNAVAAGSLSAGARRLKISPMAATRRLAALEAELGVRLLHRTTRALSVTAEGEAFLPFASRMVEAAETAKAIIAPSGVSARGRLRITSCGAIGRTVVVPVVARLLRENPKLEIDLMLTDAIVDIVSTGIDVAVRIGDLKDSDLTGTVVGKNPRLLYASPAYIAERGTPKRVDDLAAHECLLLSGNRHWHFVSEGRDLQVPVSGRFTASNVEGLYDACVESAGIAVLSRWRAEADVAEGRLVPIRLEDAEPKEHTIHALFPSNRQILPKVRIFVDALRSALAQRQAGNAAPEQREDGRAA